jgi:putative membrane protein insertion efficiency factor
MLMYPIRSLLIAALLIFLCPGYAAGEEPRVDPRNDHDGVVSPGGRQEPSESAAGLLVRSVEFYQRTISPVIGDRCPMSPSCSAYSIAAIKKHGFFIGLVMTADRLIHEIDEQFLAPLLDEGGEYKSYDPVENNDFWWADR